jgi:hypothetical protein
VLFRVASQGVAALAGASAGLGAEIACPIVTKRKHLQETLVSPAAAR